MKGIYKCKTDGNEVLPLELLESNHINSPDFHFDINQMIRYSKLLKTQRKDDFLKFPFCVTTEAEALGAQINFVFSRESSAKSKPPKMTGGPRVKTYAIETIEDVKEFINQDHMSLSKRQTTVLEAIKQSRHDECVALCVTGPLTVISSLMDQKLFYKSLKKEPGLMGVLLDKVTQHIINFSLQGLGAGARVISFADPVSGMEIIGPKTYERVCLSSVEKILKTLIDEDFGGVIHLCPKTSFGLEYLGRLNVEKHTYKAESYSQALVKHLNSTGTTMVGHRCLKDNAQLCERDVHLRVLDFKV